MFLKYHALIIVVLIMQNNVILYYRITIIDARF